MSITALSTNHSEPLIESGDRCFILDGGFSLRHGGEIKRLKVGYRLLGDLSKPCLLFLGGISANRNIYSNEVSGWWQNTIEECCFPNLQRYSLLSIDYLGGSDQTTTGWELTHECKQFSLLDTCDQAELIYQLLAYLKCSHLHAIIGASYGGMVASQFAARYPDKVEQLVLLNCAHRGTVLANSWRHIQREIIRFAISANAPEKGLGLARSLAIATYRGSGELEQRFAPELDTIHDAPQNLTPIESYLSYQGAKIINRLTPESFLCLSESIDRHAFNPRQLRVPTTVISTDSDQLIPPSLIAEFVQQLPRLSSHLKIDSAKGHDAFLAEPEQIAAILQRIFYD